MRLSLVTYKLADCHSIAESLIVIQRKSDCHYKNSDCHYSELQKVRLSPAESQTVIHWKSECYWLEIQPSFTKNKSHSLEIRLPQKVAAAAMVQTHNHWAKVQCIIITQPQPLHGAQRRYLKDIIMECTHPGMVPASNSWWKNLAYSQMTRVSMMYTCPLM